LELEINKKGKNQKSLFVNLYSEIKNKMIIIFQD